MYLRGVLVLLLFSALVFTAVGCGSDYGTASGNADSRGKLQIEETSYDFGNVPVGQKVEHKFTVTNGGTGTLELGDVDVKMLEGCWGADAVLGTKTLEPGQSTELTFSTRMSRGMGGMHIFEATIASDDPDPAQNSVQIKVNYEE